MLESTQMHRVVTVLCFFFLKETWGLVHLNQKPYTNLHLNTSYRKYFYGRYVFQGMIYGLRGTHVLTDVSV